MRRFAALKRVVVLCAVLTVFGLVVSGCSSSGGASNSVSGKILYNNAPVTGGAITVHHSSGPFPSSLNNEGKFFVNNIPEGQVTITVETESIKGAGAVAPAGMPPEMKAKFEQEKSKVGSPVGTYVAIPKKYAAEGTSDLKFTIKAGKNELGDITLKD